MFLLCLIVLHSAIVETQIILHYEIGDGYVLIAIWRNIRSKTSRAIVLI